MVMNGMSSSSRKGKESHWGEKKENEIILIQKCSTVNLELRQLINNYEAYYSALVPVLAHHVPSCSMRHGRDMGLNLQT